jgi:GT2 family glycosyltransferase
MDQSPAETGSLASKMLNFSNPNFIENAGDIFSWYGSATKRGHGQPAEEFTLLDEILSPCAGAAIYRRSFLEELGGFDEYFFAYLEDVDLGLRGRLSGYKCLFVPSAKVLHQGHGSSMTRTRYIQLITRNRLLIFIKNAPWPLLLKHFIKLLYGQWYFFIVYRKPLSSIVGYLSCIPMIPHALKERRNIKNKSKLSVKEIDNLLEKKFNMPSLSEMILNRIKAFWK